MLGPKPSSPGRGRHQDDAADDAEAGISFEERQQAPALRWQLDRLQARLLLQLAPVCPARCKVC